MRPFKSTGVRDVFKSVLIGLALAAVLICSSGIFARSFFGSIAAASAFAMGNEIFLERPVQALGKVCLGEKRTVEFPVRNLSSRPIALIGSRISCSCTTGQSWPDSLPAWSVSILRVEFAPTEFKEGQAATEQVRVFTNSVNPELTMAFTANISQRSSP